MRLTPLRPREFLKVLYKLGYAPKRQTGSHLILYNPQSRKLVSIPIHAKDLKIGLLRAILREAEIPPEGFLELLKK